jgi:hypothetical protein
MVVVEGWRKKGAIIQKVQNFSSTKLRVKRRIVVVAA